MVSDGGKNSDYFQDHSTETWEFESKEDHLTVIKLSENTHTSSKERVYFYGLKLSSSTSKDELENRLENTECCDNLRENYFFQDHPHSRNKRWGKIKTRSKMKSPPPPRASPAPVMPTTLTGTSAWREKHGTLP